MKLAVASGCLVGILMLGGCSTTPAKRTENIEALFKRADKSGDGRVSRAEYEDFMIEEMFALYDDNGDGIITEEEFVADGGTVETFRKLNRSGSGKLSKDEAMKSRLIRDHVAAPFDEADKDGSGYVTWDEFKAALEKRRAYAREG
jgi:Ca2+-binding protein (EF-Hand superfamily)